MADDLPLSDRDKEQRVLDVRLEYSLLVTNFVTLANMFWVGYGAFFTINTLLATGLGVSYSDAAHVISKSMSAVRPCCHSANGHLYLCCGNIRRNRIVDMQNFVIKRGGTRKFVVCQIIQPNWLICRCLPYRNDNW